MYKWLIWNKNFVETWKSSFYGDYLNVQGVPANHFLRKLRQITDWKLYIKKVIKRYKIEGWCGVHHLFQHPDVY